MKNFTRIMAIGLGLATAGGMVAFQPTTRAFAQAAEQPAAHHHDGGKEHEHWSPSRHIEGKLAYLHTELAITQAQEGQWQAVAQVMRAHAKQMDEAMEKHRAEHKDGDKPAHRSLVDRLQMQQTMATEHAKATGELLTALKPLYASLNDTQKKSADELFGHHGHGHRHGPM